MSSGDLFIGDSNTTLVNLGIVLSNRFHGSGTNVPIYVTGDKDTPHGAVLAVLDLVRRAGIQRVSFAVSPEGK